jgi:hypothetical protein
MARKELERLTNIEEAMEQICGLTTACNGGLLQNVHAIAHLALDPEGCADLARIPKPDGDNLSPTESDLSKCPKCGGPADNGHDRELPPNPYWCSTCSPKLD